MLRCSVPVAERDQNEDQAEQSAFLEEVERRAEVPLHLSQYISKQSAALELRCGLRVPLQRCTLDPNQGSDWTGSPRLMLQEGRIIYTCAR